MTKEFALDLKVARRNSGLTQEDCAHLLGISPTTVSKMEAGTRTPSIHEICTLSLIYGRSFESLFSGIFREVRKRLNMRLPSLPVASGPVALRLNRQNTIKQLSRRLSEEREGYEGC